MRRRPDNPATPSAEARGLQHARMAQRLDGLRRVSVLPLCLPSFLSAAMWTAAAGVGGWRRAPGPWPSMPYDVAVILTLVSPVCLAAAIVLTAISSKHGPFARVRGGWILIMAAAGCAGVALALLAGHMPA
jgi:hypothetical protein